ncbi:hypothetical protein GQ43DRAFT_431844 [Delitschia confertaspora ATCC 74209]|uniref:Amidohydrolase-related domain-containing protein n=1 Tax=Delitschia confertaspora ATCC 74209 TaxID=1513339 RepID=A0A9P4JKN9_9PLEO|nr:hypothetical protein GQ43DRAFT_431844 [Delitschia confertaspora ATCC 74209]
MGSFIIKDVRIFSGEDTIENGYIYVEDGKIKSVGPSESTPSLSILTLSKPSHTLLPGLIDTHIHANSGNPLALPQSLRFGVTTVCDMHNELPHVQKLHQQAKDPDTADYKTAGQAATIENGWPIPVITAVDKSEETARDIAGWPKLTDRENVRAYLEWNEREMKPDYIKLMHESGTAMGKEFNYPTLELQKIIVEEAQKLGYLTVAHATSLQDTLTVLEAGVNGLTHTIVDKPPTQELVEAYKRNNAWLNPTLAAMGSLTAEGKELQEKFAHDPRVQKLIGENERGNLCRCMAFSAGRGRVDWSYQSVKMLREAGVDIVCGSDAAGPALGTAWGLTMHHELHLFVHAVGMTSFEALCSATSVPARRFRFTDRGELRQGLKADLLLVEGNPLEEIGELLNVRGVWRDGVCCSTYKDVMGS